MTGSYGIPSDRVTVILNGVDTEYFQPPEAGRSGPPVILSVGRLEPQKDQEVLIEAFRPVAAEHPEAQLRLVGNGTLRENISSLAARHGFAARVQVLPGRTNLRPLFQEATVFALSSQQKDYQCGPGSHGLRPAGGGHPGRRVAGGGGAGPYRVAGPSPECAGPGCALCHLLSAPDTCQAFGRAGHEQAMLDFSLEAMVHAHEEVFLSLVKGRRGGELQAGGE